MNFPRAFTVLAATLAGVGVNARPGQSADADLGKRQPGSLIDPADLQGSMANIKPAIPLPGKPGWNIAADRLVTIPPQRDGSILIKGSGGNGNDRPKVVGPAGDVTKLDFGGSSILINDYDTNTTSVGGYDSAVNLPPYGDIACMVQGGATACAVDAITAPGAATRTASSPAKTSSTSQAKTTPQSASTTLHTTSQSTSVSPTGVSKSTTSAASLKTNPAAANAPNPPNTDLRSLGFLAVGPVLYGAYLVLEACRGGGRGGVPSSPASSFIMSDRGHGR